MPLLHLIPALMCLGGAAMMALSIRADLAAGTLDWRHRDMAIGAALILACIVAGGISIGGAFGRIA